MNKFRRIVISPKKYLKLRYILNYVVADRLFLIWRNLSHYIPSDKLFLKVYYRLALREHLNLTNPVTFTEKLQWLKLHNTSPLYAKMVDKYQVRDIVKDRIGAKFLIPLLGVWDRFEDIEFNKLPEKFVLKTTHDSGSVLVCTEKNRFDINRASLELTKALKSNYFWNSREYPYRYAIPRIIAEEYMIDTDTENLRDYKFFCFNGKPEFLLIVSKIRNKKFNNFYNMDFHELEINTGFPKSSEAIQIPENFSEMKDVATKLSFDIIHVRIDLYSINGKTYFGEYTFHHGGGLIKFEPNEWNNILGNMIVLPGSDI